MDGVASSPMRRGHELLDVEVRGWSDAAERARLVRHPCVERGGIVLGMHGHRPEPSLRCRPRNSDGDLASIGDQESREPVRHVVLARTLYTATGIHVRLAYAPLARNPLAMQDLGGAAEEET
jgi:hypothetical protein